MTAIHGSLPAALLAAAVLLAGCRTTGTAGQRRADDVATRIETYAGQVREGRAELERLLAAHELLVQATAGDLRVLYADFRRGLDAVEQRRDLLRRLRAELRAAAGAYFADWETAAAGIRDEALRAESLARLQATQQRYEAIFTIVEQGAIAVEPVLAALNDHAQYLSVELNFAAANSLQRHREQLRRGADTLSGLADAVIRSSEEYVRAAAATAAADAAAPDRQ